MRRWVTMFVLASCSIQPVMTIAQDENGEQGDATATAKSEDQTESESPIKRLAELRIDEFVVPARMINLPLPGRTQTLQEILDRLDKWSKEEKIGGVLLDLGNVRLSLPDIEELRAGIRLENNYRVTDSGVELLSDFPLEL